MAADTAPESGESALLATLADRCVQCGLCLPHCPTYRLDGTEAESPRGRIAYVKALATGQIAATEVGDRHLDHCLGCRRCEAVCPAGVEYERLLVGAREAQVRRHPRRRRHRLRLALLAHPRLLSRLLTGYRLVFRLLPSALRPLPRPLPPFRLPAPTAGSEPVALFVGCVASGYESGARAALAQLLQATGLAVELPEGQGCCGTAAAHAGDTRQAARLAEQNRRAFAGQGVVLSLASGCQQRLTDALAGTATVQDALALLDARADRLRFHSARGRRVALHLPCSQRVLGADAAVRRLLRRVPDLDLVELADTGCCGAAGLHMLEEPERAARLRQSTLAGFADKGAAELLSANIGCRLHLGMGTTIPVRHPLEFLAEHLA